jgi:alpha-tubulin suppressor-like RCC1 family protein
MTESSTSARLPEARVYVFGNNKDGQAGIRSGEESILSPTSVAAGSEGLVAAGSFSRVVCNQIATFVLTTDGTLLTAGSNDHNELGRSGKRSLLTRVDALEAFRTTDVALGENFFMLALKDGRTVSWGKNDLGQLGLGVGHRDDVPKPKIAAILSEAGGVVQISAGAHHCVALSRSGGVYTWGANRKGQLGDGFLNSNPTPQLLPQLRHRPVVSIACGEAFTLALTVGGNVYSWGDNAQGQLGQQDTTLRLRPELIRSLRASRAVRVAAGKSHACAIAPSGLLFAWGSNFFGQLGIAHATSDSTAPKFIDVPTVVEKLRPNPEKGGDDVPIEVSCGSAHTLVLLRNQTKVFTFGLGSSGQLGHASVSTAYSPCLLQLPSALAAAGEHAEAEQQSQQPQRIVGVTSGGPLSMLSFVFTEGIQLARVPIPSVDLQSLRAATRKLRDNPDQLAALNPLRQMIAHAFSSIAVLNASFRAPIHSAAAASVDSASGPSQSHSHSGGGGGGLSVQLHEVRAAYACLVETHHELVLATLGRALLQMTECLREVPTDDPENLSVFLIALENPLLLNAHQNYVALERIVSGILALPRMSRQQLFGWLRSYPSEYFARVVQVIQGYLSYGLTSRANNIDTSPAVLVLESLYQINCGTSGSGSSSGFGSNRSRIIPENYFVNEDINKHVDLLGERQKFLSAQRDSQSQSQNARVFNLLKYPFLLSVSVKARFLSLDFDFKKTRMAYRVAGSLNVCTAAYAAAAGLGDNAAVQDQRGLRTCVDTLTRQLNSAASVVPSGLQVAMPAAVMDSVVNEYLHLSRARASAPMSAQARNLLFRDSEAHPPDRVPVSVSANALFLDLTVRRERLLGDLLDSLQSLCASSGAWEAEMARAGSHPMDVLFLPLHCTFSGEVGVDAGGVSRELLTLAVQELLATYKVLRPMANGRLVWFGNSSHRNHASSSRNGFSSSDRPSAAASGIATTTAAAISGTSVDFVDLGAQIDLALSLPALSSADVAPVAPAPPAAPAPVPTYAAAKTSEASTFASTSTGAEGDPSQACVPPKFPWRLSDYFYPADAPNKKYHAKRQRVGEAEVAGQDQDQDRDDPYAYEAEFTLGLLHGLASFHGCLIDLPLPTCVYKLLVKLNDAKDDQKNGGIGAGTGQKEPDIGDIFTLGDLWECDDVLAHGLQTLLDLENDGTSSIYDTFGVTFVSSANPLDPLAPSGTAVELLAGGHEKVVDYANRRLFVDLFVKNALFGSVSHAAQAFLRGLQVFFFCTKPAEFYPAALRSGVPSVSTFEYRMCSAQELEELLCGSRELGDISTLRLGSLYRGEFHDEHKIIHWLWEVLSDMPLVTFRKFLMFVTGSDRTPVGGLQNLRIIIQSTRPVGDVAATATATAAAAEVGSEALPASHTCFNTLDLPVTYASKEQLRAKLLKALEHATGFGLV